MVIVSKIRLGAGRNLPILAGAVLIIPADGDLESGQSVYGQDSRIFQSAHLQSLVEAGTPVFIRHETEPWSL